MVSEQGKSYPIVRFVLGGVGPCRWILVRSIGRLIGRGAATHSQGAATFVAGDVGVRSRVPCGAGSTQPPCAGRGGLRALRFATARSRSRNSVCVALVLRAVSSSAGRA